MTDDAEPGFRNLTELEAAGIGKMTESARAYVEGGSGAERTLRENLAAFARWALRPRALAGSAEVDLRTTLLSESLSAPFFVAPTAYQGTIHPGGECETAQAAARTAVLAAFSTFSSRSLEEIAAASGQGSRWFQLYLQPEFEQSAQLVRRAESAGYTALVLTVDAPMIGVRDRQARGSFATNLSVRPGNGPQLVEPPASFRNEGGRLILRPDLAVGWEILDQLQEVTRMPIVVKGLLTPEDAIQAVDHGARAIVVSNHGGRQLDGALTSLEALPDVAEAVGPKAEVYMDGGVRRGSDVLIALALGARAVGLGRPILWALAAGGAAGVSHYLELLRYDLAVSMTLAGRSRVTDIDRTLVQPRKS